jgi:hypothetical protein
MNVFLLPILTLPPAPEVPLYILLVVWGLYIFWVISFFQIIGHFYFVLVKRDRKNLRKMILWGIFLVGLTLLIMLIFWLIDTYADFSIEPPWEWDWYY